MLPLIKPARLQPGQTIGLIAPASPVDDDELVHAAIETVASLGFQVKPGRHLFARHGYLAGSDAQRAADLNAMFGDPSIDAIMVLRGGYGSSRLLPALDYELMHRNPKVFMGYSDLTTVLNAITAQTGLVTFHGPIMHYTFTEYTLGELDKVLFTPQAPVVIGAPPPFAPQPGRVERTNRVTTIVGGKARGRLVGGNLTLLTHLLGTPYAPDFAGKILFLEDVREEIYRIDRMLTQLWLAGAFAQAAGVALGKFTEYGQVRGFTLAEVLAERCRAQPVPAVRGLMIGHVADMTVIPIGCEAELDADAGTLTLLETAVADSR
jgi:muramoyltetrapeptide carboxypeptidase